jgi:hypothetical protein
VCADGLDIDGAKMLVHIDTWMCIHIEYRRIAFPYGKVTAASFFNALLGLISMLKPLLDQMPRLSTNLSTFDQGIRSQRCT